MQHKSEIFQSSITFPCFEWIHSNDFWDCCLHQPMVVVSLNWHCPNHWMKNPFN